MTNGEKIIKAKAVERLKGDSETTEQRKAVTVGIAFRILPAKSVITPWEKPCTQHHKSDLTAPGLMRQSTVAVSAACGCADNVWEACVNQGPGGLLQRPVPAGPRQNY